jgi:phage gp46-like protein
MSALLQSLQGSIRTPLSREEMLRCVEVLASEVAPEYLSIVKMGAISSVVINQAARPHDVRARLVALGAM